MSTYRTVYIPDQAARSVQPGLESPLFPKCPGVALNVERDYKQLLSHNNPCFQCNIAITNFLVSYKCEIRFHNVIGQSTVHMSIG